MPATGLYGYSNAARRFGIKRTIDALIAVGAAFTAAQGGLRLGIGDICLLYGGPIGGHPSHQRGIDVDIRPLRSDGAEAPVTFQRRNIRARAPSPGRRAARQHDDSGEIDPLQRYTGARRVTLAGHDNHLHVRFKI